MSLTVLVSVSVSASVNVSVCGCEWVWGCVDIVLFLPDQLLVVSPIKEGERERQRRQKERKNDINILHE
jgi:hypothetical protein